jgi:hypothetical protein
MFSLEDIGKYKAKFFPQGIIVDTNILILFLIGSYDPSFIESCDVLNNNNKTYTIKDFELLKKIFKYFKKVVITPQIIAELSNLSITKGVHGDKLLPYLKTVIKFLQDAEEHHQKLDCLFGMELSVISRYGFTDMTIFELSKQTKMPILTDELPFYTYSYGKVPIIKFEHIKNYHLQSVFSN